ncbi:MAG: prolyl aminopeptidase [Gammaproteobacteria bacterium]|nr:prolyl aminopeptidase [Gammaproteobacteria bacterium]
MRGLYPEIHQNLSFTVTTGDGHELYVEECGVAEGIPVIFLHGGPGAGCEAWHRQFFDPERYRIILFDQRGSGRSTPHASLGNNTSQHLVEDIERIRTRLGIEKWLVFGGSWGSTLGLLYAETHPQRVTGLILRGIFLCRPKEIHWFYQEGASRIFPDFWQEFIAPIPQNERDDLVEAHYRRLVGDDEIARMASAKAWSIWEGKTSNLKTKPSVVDFFGSPHTALSLSRIEAHYFVHNSFLRDNQLLEDARAIQDIPGFIIHGRYDMVCPIESAWELALAWPNAQLQIVPGAGHSASEPGIVHALITATDWFADELE